MPFIIVNESFEKVASYGLMPNMIFYLMEGYQMQVVSATNILFLWSATSNTMAIFGAFLSDSYLGRFRVISLGSISSLLGMTILWLTAMIPQLKPPSCESQQVCESATAAQLALLLSSFGLISIGAGCIRPCSIAFGADQLDNKENPNKERLLASFFNWYYASIGVSTVLALTLIVYIQDNLGWMVGFGVPVILMIISTLIFLAGRSLYVKVKPSKSLFTGFAQVVVVAFKNRKLSLPQSNSDQYCHSHDSNFLVPTDNLRYL
uniref:Major facilitator superfamily (MFS) profile domain-containing protein n=1 Tax=Fagus sylvatica TaxID=28930 RepID=A0A2N9HND9_FAGSY